VSAVTPRFALIARLLPIIETTAGLVRTHWRRAVTQTLARLCAPFALYLSLVALRQDLLATMEIPREQALILGLHRGYYFDFAVILYPTLVAQVLWAFAGIPKRITWPAGAFLIWFASLANLLHYKFFGTRLDWWVVSMHWSDFFLVQGSAAQLGASRTVVVSMLLALVAVVLGVFPRLTGRQTPVRSRGAWWPVHRWRLAWVVLLIVACSVAYHLPRLIYGGRSAASSLTTSPASGSARTSAPISPLAQMPTGTTRCGKDSTAATARSRVASCGRITISSSPSPTPTEPFRPRRPPFKERRAAGLCTASSSSRPKSRRAPEPGWVCPKKGRSR